MNLTGCALLHQQVQLSVKQTDIAIEIVSESDVDDLVQVDELTSLEHIEKLLLADLQQLWHSFL